MTPDRPLFGPTPLVSTRGLRLRESVAVARHHGDMPEIARLGGIVLAMYHDDHQMPHFHARYAEYRASVRLDPLGVLAGELPRPELRTVLEWAAEHAAELAAEWALVAADQPPAGTLR